MSELKKELEQDKAFVEEVSNRIYSDADDIDEYMPEPEWIDRMTDIADKYITRFELAQKLVDKHLSSKHLQLNENQKIVFEWLKEEYFDSYVKSVLSNLYFYVNMTAIGDLENRKIQLMVKAYEELDDKEFIQVLAAFAQWALE